MASPFRRDLLVFMAVLAHCRFVDFRAEAVFSSSEVAASPPAIESRHSLKPRSSYSKDGQLNRSQLRDLNGRLAMAR